MVTGRKNTKPYTNLGFSSNFHKIKTKSIVVHPGFLRRPHLVSPLTPRHNMFEFAVHRIDRSSNKSSDLKGDKSFSNKRKERRRGDNGGRKREEGEKKRR